MYDFDEYEAAVRARVSEELAATGLPDHLFEEIVDAEMGHPVKGTCVRWQYGSVYFVDYAGVGRYVRRLPEGGWTLGTSPYARNPSLAHLISEL